MYVLKHNFNEYNYFVAEYMKLLIRESDKKFQSQLENGEIGNGKNERKVLSEMYKDIEEYLYICIEIIHIILEKY